MSQITITITGLPPGSPLATMAAEAERAKAMGFTRGYRNRHHGVTVSHEALVMLVASEIRLRTPTSTPQPPDTQTSQPSDASPLK